MQYAQSGASFDVYAHITQQIVDAIQQGTSTYRMPWHRSGKDFSLPQNAATGASYHGVNVLSLWISAAAKGYSTARWASYRQWQGLGAQVRGGETGSVIVFFKQLDDAEPSENKREDKKDRRRTRYVARASRVFNAAQIEGWEPEELEVAPPFETDDRVEAFIAATQAQVQHGFDGASYRYDRDVIQMPHRDAFRESEHSSAVQSYYAVLLHELTHWTGAPHRLNRTFGKQYADSAYAFEELVAELGAAFLCSSLGIANEPRPDHAAYVSSWLKTLNSDRRAIFAAARHAQEAVQFLSSLAEQSLEM